MDAFATGVPVNLQAAVPGTPADVARVLGYEQTWVGLASRFEGVLTSFHRDGQGLSAEASMRIPTEGMPDDVRHVLGAMADLHAQVGWRFVEPGRLEGSMEVSSQSPLERRVDVSGTVEVSAEGGATLTLTLRTQRIPSQVAGGLAEAAQRIGLLSMDVIREHLRSSTAVPAIDDLNRLISRYWAAGNKPRWIREKHGVLIRTSQEIAFAIARLTPFGVPAGELCVYDQLVDAGLTEVLALERACRFAEATYGGQKDKSVTANTVALRARACAESITRAAGLPQPPALRPAPIRVAGLESGHPRVPVLFALILDPGERAQSAWRISTTDWWLARGYMLITNRRLVVVHDDSFNDTGGIDRTYPLAEVSNATVTTSKGKAGGPDIGMDTKKGRVVLEFSRECSVGDAEALVGHLLRPTRFERDLLTPTEFGERHGLTRDQVLRLARGAEIHPVGGRFPALELPLSSRSAPGRRPGMTDD